jgi:hypothetical protein
VLASGFIGDPGLEIGFGRVWVIVLVVLAIVPIVLLVPLTVRGLPLVVDMDVGRFSEVGLPLYGVL